MSKIRLIELNDLPIQLIDGDRGVNYPSKSEFTNDGYCVFLNTGNVTKTGFDFSNIEFINEERDLLLRKGKLQFNDIVLTTRGTVGNVGFYHNKNSFEHIRINSGMIILRCVDNKIYPYYLFLFLRSEIFKKQVLDQASGSAQPQLPIGSLKNISFPFYEFGTQQKIAKVLSDLDSKIEINNRINSELEAMAKTLYDYWFVQFDFPDANGKPYKSWGGKMVYNAELKREIPEGWEVTELKNIAKNLMGQSPKGESYNKEGIGMPLLNGPADYENGSLLGRTYTTEPTRICQKDDMVLCIRATIGKLTYAEKEFCLGRGVAAVRPNEKRFSEYLFYCLIQEIERFKIQATGSIIVGITKDDLTDSKCIIPQNDLLDNFHKISNPIFINQRKRKGENLELASLRDWLLPMLMNGQVSVGDVVEELGMVAETTGEY
jgi:type I restriction enzyme S subunit